MRVLECGVYLFLHENLEGGVLPWLGGAPRWGRTRGCGPMRRGDRVGTSHVSVGSARVVRHVHRHGSGGGVGEWIILTLGWGRMELRGV